MDLTGIQRSFGGGRAQVMRQTLGVLMHLRRGLFMQPRMRSLAIYSEEMLALGLHSR